MCLSAAEATQGEMATEVKLVLIEGGETKPGGDSNLSREPSSLDFIFLEDHSYDDLKGRLGWTLERDEGRENKSPWVFKFRCDEKEGCV